jgi:NADH:ubiquinone oxidoreductase subunit D
MEFYERSSGARMHAAFHRPSVFFDEFLDSSFFSDLLFFTKNCYSSIEEIHNILSYNKI